MSDVIRCLAEGRPVVFGTQAGSQWDRYHITLSRQNLNPIRPETSKVGHVTVLVGYKDGLFIGENSWGTSWGYEGFYFADPRLVSSDTSGNFWVID